MALLAWVKNLNQLTAYFFQYGFSRFFSGGYFLPVWLARIAFHEHITILLIQVICLILV